MSTDARLRRTLEAYIFDMRSWRPPYISAATGAVKMIRESFRKKSESSGFRCGKCGASDSPHTTAEEEIAKEQDESDVSEEREDAPGAVRCQD